MKRPVKRKISTLSRFCFIQKYKLKKNKNHHETSLKCIFFLNQALKAMGRKPSRVEVKDMIGEADADGNGSIEFSEFAALMEK